ncbi:uncharacterized protein V1516DRAFT_451922 [Lipomyces oligophaga]|uniref:uncharacterized protein n=1 Tax=Lipomyces oligophaga TaxID=45792 RepID=UPI0034CF9E02
MLFVSRPQQNNAPQDSSVPQSSSSLDRQVSPASALASSPSSSNNSAVSHDPTPSNSTSMTSCAPPSRPPDVYASLPSSASSSSSRPLPLSSSSSSPVPASRSRSLCAACQKPLEPPTMRALDRNYHKSCFVCADCGKSVVDRFFPLSLDPSPSSTTTTPNSSKSTSSANNIVPLCEHDYFRRKSLLCHVCGNALRGDFVVAIGRRYHLEHFSCSLCGRVFQADDNYYERDGAVYCHYDFSLLFAERCEGCDSAILKQFIENLRNGRHENWHPECYMIHKSWNASLASRPKGLDSAATDPGPHNGLELKKAEEQALLDREQLKQKQKLIENKVYRIWTVLSEFEEVSAAAISDMLHYATAGSSIDSILATSRLIYRVNVLFSAIDTLQQHPQISSVRRLGKEPKTLCKNVVGFLTNLPGSLPQQQSPSHNTENTPITEDDCSPSWPKDVIELVKSMAHYLKLLIQYALGIALQLDNLSIDSHAVNDFLDYLASHNSPPIFSRETLLPNITDLCVCCRKGIEEKCTRLMPADPSDIRDRRWHLAASCFSCSRCHRSLATLLPTALWSDKNRCLLCPDCALPEDKSRSGFVFVSRLNQYSFLLKVAIHRVYKNFSDTVPPSQSIQSVLKRTSTADRHELVESYVNTLTDIRRMRSSRFKRTISDPKGKQARRSKTPVLLDGQRPTESSSPHDLAESSSPAVRRRVSERSSRSRNNQTIVGRKLSFSERPRKTTPQQAEKSTREREVTEDDLYSRAAAAAVAATHANASRSKSDNMNESPDRLKEIPNIKKSDKSYHPNSGLTEGSPDRKFLKSSRPLVTEKPDVLFGEKYLTLDDIPRIVAAEQAREQRPNAFRHQRLSSLALSNGLVPKLVSKGPTIGPDSSEIAKHSMERGMSTTGSVLTLNATSGISVELPNPKYFAELTDAEYLIVRKRAYDELEGLVSDFFTQREYAEFAGDSPIAPRTSPSNPKVGFWEKFGRAFTKNNSHSISSPSAGKGLTSPSMNAGALSSPSSSSERQRRKAGNVMAHGMSPAPLVFKVPLEELLERSGTDSDLGVCSVALKVPTFLDDIISAMRNKDMSIEGVFRKNGNIRRSRALVEEMDLSGSSHAIREKLNNESPVQLAALLKKFLRDMPDPLLTFRLFRIWVSSQRITDDGVRRRALHLCCCLLPRSHRDSMEIIFNFLKWVASFSQIDEESGSKMDIHNISTVITPNILYSPHDLDEDPISGQALSNGPTAVSIGGDEPGTNEGTASSNAASNDRAQALAINGDTYFLAIETVNTLIENNEDYATVPMDFIDSLNMKPNDMGDGSTTKSATSPAS